MKRASGALLHISSLPSHFGIGDLGPAAYAFADRLAAARQSYWQVLPLNPTSARDGHSPYVSASALAGNPLLISPELLLEQGLLAREDVDAARMPCTRTVNYTRAAALRKRLLDRAFAAARSRADIQAQVETFGACQASWLDDHALFTAAREHFRGAAWPRWPAALRDRRPAELARAAREWSHAIAREKFRQFVFHSQWFALKSYCNARGVGIIGDVPIYVSHDSADVWTHRRIFKLDAGGRPTAVSGVPPDYFSATGQLWNNPVYAWDVLARTGYDWWVARLRAKFERFDVVRIDHFRGLVQYWEIPAGDKTAIRGTWRDVPTDDFFDTLVRHFAHFPVIAEDLGLITPDVRQAMARYKLPGMKVLLFAFGAKAEERAYLPHNFERHCVVYTGTHDNNTVRGWLQGEADADEKRRLFDYLGRRLRPRDAVRELIRAAMMSVADTAIFPVQDLLALGAPARMNRLSTTRGNWLWRMTPPQLDALDTQWLAALTTTYDRAPP